MKPKAFDDYVFPGARFGPTGHMSGQGMGMTMRQFYAGQALAGLMADPNSATQTPELIADCVVTVADAVIAELARRVKDGDASDGVSGG